MSRRKDPIFIIFSIIYYLIVLVVKSIYSIFTSYSQPKPIKKPEKSWDNEDYTFEFAIDGTCADGSVAKHKLRKCNVGDEVTLYVPAGVKRGAVVFHGDIAIPHNCREKSAYLLGAIEKKHVRPFTDHYHDCKPYQARISSIDGREVKIQCTLYSREVTDAKRKPGKKLTQKEKVRIELSKKYTPRKDLRLLVILKKKNIIVVGEKLYLRKKTLEDYLQEGKLVEIEFINKNGRLVGIGDNYPNIKNIIKAQLNGHIIEIEVLELSTDPSKYGSLYFLNVDYYEALIQVRYLISKKSTGSG